MNNDVQKISETERSRVKQNTINAVVIGVGLPGRSMGWLHLTQLLNMDSVSVRHIVEPWWLDKKQAQTDAGKEFFAACEALELSQRGVAFHTSVKELPRLEPNIPCLAVIASRTPDAPTLFKAAVEKGATHIYLEKPGAQTTHELREMSELAARAGVVVIVGYQKTVSDYVKQAYEADREWRSDVVNLRFEHHNPYHPEELESVFRANREGMLLNQCCHELALWSAKWKIQPKEIIDVIVHREDTQLERFGEIEDFSKLAFTATTTQGRNFTLAASRCGGTDSRITVQKGIVGEKKIFVQASPELHKQAERVLAESPNTAWYYPLFESDYLKLKQEFVAHILAGKDGVPPDAPTLTDAVFVLELAESLSPALLAQVEPPVEHVNVSQKNVPHGAIQELAQQEAPTIKFTTRDVVCRTPTEQRIWYAPDIFNQKCSLLIDVLRPPQGRIILCIDDKVWLIYQGKIESWAVAQGIELIPITVPGGEQGKSVEAWQQVMNRFWTANPLPYTEPIVAIGGGAVTDTVGFVAAVWRGSTPWVRIPTTLLGMVDASVGIKVSVNYLRKNGLGAFHSPRHTLIDPFFLRTNDEQQLKAGVGEMMRVGLIYDKRIYALLRAEGPGLLREKFLGANAVPCNTAKNAILFSIKAKINCIGSDLYEENLSREMDFGHTFSSWLERHQEFQLMHGEAVSIDCVFSTLIAEQKGWVSREEMDDVLETYKNMGLFVYVRGLTLDVYQTAIEQLSVHRSGTKRAPLPSPIGHCRWTFEITQDELAGAWQRLQAFLSDYREGILEPNCVSKDNSAPTDYRAKDGQIVEPMDKLPNSTGIVRWGILGCGKIANDFVNALQTVPNAVVAAVAARDTGRARDFAVQHGVSTSYDNYSQLVEDANVDIVYVATIPELHRQHAELALGAGKHVLVEKPLATTVEDAEAIQRLAKANGKFCMEGMWMRFFPAVELARQQVREGKIGKIRHIRADFGFDLFADEGSDNPKWAVGAGMNAGVYPTHAAVMLFGSELVKLGATGITDNLGYNMDAEGVLYASFSEGRTATITWSHLVGTPEEVKIVGTQGTISLHPPAHCPTKITIVRQQGNRRSSQINSLSCTHEFPLPVVEGEFFYPNSAGFYYEAAAVQRCILSGLTECPQAPLSESVLVIKMVRQGVNGIVTGKEG